MDTRLQPVRHEMIEEADANLLSLIKTRGCGEGGRTEQRSGMADLFSKIVQLTTAQGVSKPASQGQSGETKPGMRKSLKPASAGL